jgi:hypothetical protein
MPRRKRAAGVSSLPPVPDADHGIERDETGWQSVVDQPARYATHCATGADTA